MATPRALVVRAPGTNCDEETARAWELAGARAETWPVGRLLESPETGLSAFQAITFPGGFSYGDDLGAGRVLALKLRRSLGDALERFRDRGGLVLGICNGFQVLVKAGLLPGGGRAATLAANDSGRYEARWVALATEAGPGPWFDKVQGRVLELPSAHGEGKFLADDLDGIERAGHVALRYVDGSGAPTEAFPANPSGSPRGIAGARDASGQVLGLMPHPERFVTPWHHPKWTRGPLREAPDGLLVFQGAVEAIKA